MDLKKCVLCVLIGIACISLCTALNDSAIGSSPDIGSNLNSTELGSRPMLDIYFLQKLVDDASDGSSVTIKDDYVSSVPLHIDKNITLTGSPIAYIDGQGTSQILKIDNPKVSVTLENFLVMHGKGDYGGAISSQAKSLTINECRFLDSSANYGAAIYQKGGNLQVRDSTFEGNNATIWGSAIYGNSGDVQVESSQFAHNPGCHVICFNGSRPKKVNVLIKECSVSDNEGAYNEHGVGHGGAIACANSTMLIDHCSIKGNKALVMTPLFLGGGNAGLLFSGSCVALNNTLIEGNEALRAAAICVLYDSKIEINRCDIRKNHAQSVLFYGKYRGGECAGIVIDDSSEVAMNDTTLEGNIADDEVGAIWSAGKLSLNAGTIITRNRAKRYSALYSLESGVVIKGKGVRIYDNHDDNPNGSICIEGILKSAES
jgi:hypothetical protein